MNACKVKLSHDLDVTYQLHKMQYETDLTNKKENATNFKTKVA